MVLLAKAILEPIVVLDVPIALLELVERGLKDLNGTLLGQQMGWYQHTTLVAMLIAACIIRIGVGVQDNRLLASGDNAVDLLEHLVVDQLIQQQTCAGIQTHLGGGHFFMFVRATTTRVGSQLVEHLEGTFRSR